MSQADFDSPWKDVLDLLFEQAMELFFPEAHAQIDWARGYEFLDKELQKITADAALGRRTVDKLVKVWLKTGQEMWVLIHIEVQGERETGFETRVYVYNFRSFDRFNVPVATFVILTDEEKNWRPGEYRRDLLGTEVRMKFPAAKLLDFADRWDELEQSNNPFAVVVQAHLTALRTRDNAQDRLQAKWQLTRRLYERGFDKRVIVGLYLFLDWVLTLPEALGVKYKRQLSEYEEEKKMRYVSSIERMGIEQGIQEGSAGIILRLLQQRFGALDEAVQTHIRALPLRKIEALSDALFSFTRRADLEAWLKKHPQPKPKPQKKVAL
jgi:hypothetical protein